VSRLVSGGEAGEGEGAGAVAGEAKDAPGMSLGGRLVEGFIVMASKWY
jgi:hypothetical protein